MKTMNVAVFLFAAAILGFKAPSTALASEKIKVVTTTTSLADIAAEVGKDKLKVEAIASPQQDIHRYMPTPKDVLRVKKADVLIHEGLDLESWRGPLLDAAGNPRLTENSIDTSHGIALMEIPVSLSREQGDIHAFGNPHYIGSPENAGTIASNIAAGLSKISPEDADFFKKNAEDFNRRLDEKINEWRKRMAPFQGENVVTYHKSWAYFLRTFKLTSAGEIEPKPGIPPTAKHLAELRRVIKDRNVKVIIREPFEESRSPKKLADETGARVVTLSQAVGEPKGADDYISMMEQNILALETALKSGSHD